MPDNKSQSSSQYLHGTDPAEQDRLGLMNRLLNESCLRELGLAGGERLLDVGCGLAQFTRQAARSVGRAGKVVGVERDRSQIEAGERLAAAAGDVCRIELRQGDATALPLEPEEWGTFDVAHARFVLEHVPQPLDVLRQMVQAVRPGGRIVLCDDDHDLFRLHPEPAGFAPLIQAYVRVYDRLGNDPFVGRRLVSLLHQAGARPARCTYLFFGGCSGQELFPVVVENMLGILKGARSAILEEDLLDQKSFDAAMVALAAWGRQPDAAFWYAIPWAEGIRQ